MGYEESAIRSEKDMRKIAYILLSAITVILYSACTAARGSVLIRENIAGTGCGIEFVEWSGQNKCELSFDRNDELLVNIDCDGGSISLDIRSKSGAEAYRGNSLEKTAFTVKTPEKGEYVITIKGDHATGSTKIKKVNK